MALVKLLQIKQPKSHKGFVLPSVVTASIVMLIVLTVSVSATVTARVALKEQYYAQLGQAAADAGLEYAKSCLRSNGNKPLWTDVKPLKPNTDCSGNETVSCPTTSTDPACSVLLNGNIRTVFSVPLPTVDASGYATYVKYSGTTEILRASTKAVWRSYEQRGSWQTNFATFVPIVSDGLVLNLDAANPYSYPKFGTTWYDLSGNSRNFTLVNSPNYSIDGQGALTFNGTSQYGTIPYTSSPFRQSSAITYDFWIKNNSNWSTIAGTTISGGNGSGGIAVGYNGIGFYFTPTTPNSDTLISATYPNNIGLWRNYVFTMNYSNGVAQWYENGTMLTTSYSQSVTSYAPRTEYNVNSGTDLIGGRSVNGVVYYYNGTLSTFRLYDRGLSASEVMQNFNASRARYGL